MRKTAWGAVWHRPALTASGGSLTRPATGSSSADLMTFFHVFTEGLASASLDGKWGFIDQAGDWVIQPQFGRVGPFFEGLARASTGDDQWGFIDQAGNWVIQPKFYWVWTFSEGLAQGHHGR